MKTKENRERRALIVWIVLSAAVAAVIFSFSAQPAGQSDAVSKGLVAWILKTFFSESSLELIQRWDTPIRKAAHFTLYFLLGFCLTGAFGHQKRLPKVPAAIGTAGIYAALDELHQHFVEGRGPQMRDVLLDACGAAAGAMCLALILYLVSKRKKT